MNIVQKATDQHAGLIRQQFNGDIQIDNLSGTTVLPRQHVLLTEKALVAATATIVANITIPASKFIGGLLIGTVHANDASDFQAITDFFSFSAVNKAGTVTAIMQAAPTTSQVATSSGTLTPVTWSIVANGASVDIKVAATSSLTETVLAATWQLFLNCDGASVITKP